MKINNGYAKRFDNLCRINTSLKKGNTIMSIFSAKKRKFPMNIKMMEKTSPWKSSICSNE